jgi:RND family efflux transporter MFP subunit
MKITMNKTRVATIVVIVVIAAVSFWAGGTYRGRTTDGTGAPGQRTVLYYSDPMNPGFRSDKPGIAPCGMPLEPVYADTAGPPGGPSLPSSAVRIGPERQQLIGVKTAVAQRQPMTYTLRLYGKVVPDETRVFRVNASTDSWIRELSDVTTGSIVRKDQVLAEALAPAYYNAQVTYLIALDNIDRIKQQLGGQLRHQQGDLANNQIRVAVQALQNLGIGDAQIEELANTRKARPYLQVRAPTDGVVLKRSITQNQWFKAAEEFFTIADIRRLWIYADVYENEARHLSSGMSVRVNHAQLGRTFDARVSEVLPLFDPLSKTLKVRLDVSNPRYELRPDMFVDVEIPITMPDSLHLPADAVIDSGTKNTVYVETVDGVFEPRVVETGWRLGRQIEITGGLMPGERVVVSGNFLIDSESRMKSAAADPAERPSIDLVCGMNVDPRKAERDQLTAEHAGKTYYFCSRQCVQAFDREPQRFAARSAAKSEEFLVSRDPVCGMNVHREIAENSRRTTAHEGKTFYFCSEDCLARFQKEPLKYAGTAPPAQEHTAMAAADRKVNRARQPAAQAGPRSAEQGPPAQQPHAPGHIDWKGPDPVQRTTGTAEWKGWGRFPGAEYLGLRSESTGTAGAGSDTQEPGGGAAADTTAVTQVTQEAASQGPGLHSEESRTTDAAGGPVRP